jgi:hypothetical protein
VEAVLGKPAKKKKIQEIPLSNNTVKVRIEKMSYDIEEQLLVKVKNSPYFALQCDESTDVTQCCQLLVFVRFLDEDNRIKGELFITLPDMIFLTDPTMRISYTYLSFIRTR